MITKGNREHKYMSAKNKECGSGKAQKTNVQKRMRNRKHERVLPRSTKDQSQKPKKVHGQLCLQGALL
jgi:hypothetical protein